MEQSDTALRWRQSYKSAVAQELRRARSCKSNASRQWHETCAAQELPSSAMAQELHRARMSSRCRCAAAHRPANEPAAPAARPWEFSTGARRASARARRPPAQRGPPGSARVIRDNFSESICASARRPRELKRSNDSAMAPEPPPLARCDNFTMKPKLNLPLRPASVRSCHLTLRR